MAWQNMSNKSWTLKTIKHKYETETRAYLKHNGPTSIGIRGESQNKEHSLAQSITRTKSVVHDYARNNHWDYFITLTFNPKKVDSTDKKEVLETFQTFSRWLRKNGNKYLAIPEYHKDGKKIHLHCLVQGSLPLTATELQTSAGQVIYNLDNWEYGFTTAIKIGETVDDGLRLASYVCKYMTKDLTTIFNQKRFWASNGLNRGQVISVRLVDQETINLIPWTYDSDEQSKLDGVIRPSIKVCVSVKPQTDIESVPNGSFEAILNAL